VGFDTESKAKSQHVSMNMLVTNDDLKCKMWT